MYTKKLEACNSGYYVSEGRMICLGKHTPNAEIMTRYRIVTR